jgi:hypothetical protein
MHGFATCKAVGVFAGLAHRRVALHVHLNNHILQRL